MARKLTTKELGLYKTRISNALLKSDDIKELMFGDTSNLSQKDFLLEFE